MSKTLNQGVKNTEDQQYINELEKLLLFVSSCYESAKYVFYDKHIETCSSGNPNRRELTDIEFSELSRFPTVQGFSNRHFIQKLAKKHKPSKTNWELLEKRILSEKED